MIDSPSDITLQDEKLKKYAEMIKKDTVDEKTYQEIYKMIPEIFLVEKDREMNDKRIGIHRKVTKRKLNKENDKTIIDKLKAFALEKKFSLGNQLAFNDHFDDIYIWTVYLVK